jgi:hypothetical protein
MMSKWRKSPNDVQMAQIPKLNANGTIAKLSSMPQTSKLSANDKDPKLHVSANGKTPQFKH